MTRALSPTSLSPIRFAMRQSLAQATPPVVLAVLLGALWWKFGPQTPPGIEGVVLSLAGMLLFTIITGGLPVIYFAWWIDLQRKGLVPSPRVPWRLDLADGVLAIRTTRAATRVRLGDARSLTLVIDDNWDQMKGMEDNCLVIGLPWRLRIIVPGTSERFDELLGQIRQEHEVIVRVVE